MDSLISLAIAAQAAGEVRTPLSYGILTWAWVIGISAAGGLANFHRNLSSGHARPFNFMELMGEVFTAVFVGTVTFLFCEWSGVNQLLTGGLCGLAGHMGTRAIFLAEQTVERYVQSRYLK